MKIHVKKLWKGQFVSVRDYDLQAIIENKGSLTIEHDGLTMTIPWNEIQTRGKKSLSGIQSRFGQQTYTLYDFRWQPDKARNLVLPLN